MVFMGESGDARRRVRSTDPSIRQAEYQPNTCLGGCLGSGEHCMGQVGRECGLFIHWRISEIPDHAFGETIISRRGSILAPIS